MAATLAPSEGVAPTLASGDAATAEPATVPLATVDPKSYVIADELARGGLGRIFRARDRRLDRVVAIKELLHGGEYSERFMREALLTARLQHPGIVPIHEAGRWPTGEPFYAMKLVTGRTLEEAVRSKRTLEERIALLPQVIAVAEAIAYAHAQHIIHRDLKPANVIVGEYGETIVIDWGLAKDLRRDAPEATGPTRGGEAGATVEGSVMGTPSYMPPEQARGERVDERADVYALGAILYHVIAGRPPITGKTVDELLRKALAGEVRPIDDEQPGVPADLAAIVSRAMQRDAADRYPTAGELAADLRRFQTGQLVASHRYTLGERLRRWVKRNRRVVAVGSLAILGLAITIAVAFVRITRANDRAERDRDAALREQARAEERADAAVLASAREALVHDPVVALGWVRKLTKEGSWAAARTILAEARQKGLSRVLATDAEVRRIAFSADGKWLASAAVDGTIRRWDVAKGVGSVLPAPLGKAALRAARELAIAPDGSWVAIVHDGTLIVWRGTGPPQALEGSVRGAIAAVDNGHVRGMLEGKLRTWDIGAGTYVDVAMPSSNAMLASDGGAAVATQEVADNQGFVLIDAVTGKPSLMGITVIGRPVAVSPDRTRLAVIEPQDGLVVYRDAGREEIRLEGSGVVPPPSNDPHERFRILEVAAAWGKDSTLLVVGDELGRVRWWRIGDGTEAARRYAIKPVMKTLLVGQAVTAVAVAPDSAQLAIRRADGAVLLVDTETARSRELRGHRGGANAIAFSPDGALLATAGVDDSIRLWETRNGDRVITTDEREAARSLAFSRDGLHLLAAGETTALYVLADRRRIDSVGSNAMAARLDGKRVVMAILSEGGLTDAGEPLVMAGVWTVGSGKWESMCGGTPSPRDEGSMGNPAIQTARRHVADERKPAADVTLDGSGVAFANNDRVFVCDVAAKRFRSLPNRAKYPAVAFSPDGTTLAAASERGVAVWARTSDSPRVLAHARDVTALAFAPDGTLATGTADGVVQIWDVATATPRPGTGSENHSHEVSELAFSARGRFLVSTGDNVIVRDLVAGTAAKFAERGAFGAVAISSDETRLAAAAADGTVWLWDLGDAAHGHRVVGRARGPLAFSPDGSVLAATTGDQILLFVDDLPRGEPALRRWLAAPR